MRRSRWLPAGLALLLAAGACGYAAFERARPAGPALAIRDAYLLVSVEAPPAWIEQHHPAITWQGREVRLPVVLRCRFAGSRGPDWGAVPEEARQALTIHGVEVPVRVSPPTACRVSNEPAFGLIPERGATVSVATWVSVGPPDRPSVGPVAAADRVLASGESVAGAVAGLVAAGQVIDVGSAP